MDSSGHRPPGSPLGWRGVGSSCRSGHRHPQAGPLPLPLRHRAENKLEKNEEAALLSWEVYLKENYLQSVQSRQRQRPEHRVQHISDRCWGPGGCRGRELSPGRVQGTVWTWPPGGGPATGPLGPETPAVPWRGATSSTGPQPSLRVLGRPPVPWAGWPREAPWAGWSPREAPWGRVAGVLEDGQLGPQEANWEPGRWTVSATATASVAPAGPGRLAAARAPSARPSRPPALPPALPPFGGQGRRWG